VANVTTNGRGTTAEAVDAALRIDIPPDARCSRAVRERISAYALSHGVAALDAQEFVTAVAEAVANAVEHSRTVRTIEVECSLGERRLTASVVDYGVGFSPELLRAPAPPDPLAERGRGLPIMRQCSHFLAIDSVPGEGTSVTLGRYLDEDDGRMLAS